ncbi:hypothetical protein PTI98_013399 [Pleurotus ostreatus]|nr:hypothetical protein PTI98_013399 [Pleurotus ostreatus]
MRTTIEEDASQTDDTLPPGDSNQRGQNTAASSHILGHLLTTPITIAQVLTSFYRGRPMQRAVTLAPDALDGQVVSEHIEGRWYHDLDNVATYIGEDSGGRGRESPTPGHVHDIVLSQPLYERELSPLSLMDCDTAPLGNDDHRGTPSTHHASLSLVLLVHPLPEGLSPLQWYLPNDPLYREAPPRNENHQVLRMDPIGRLCDQVSGLAQVIQTDRQQLGDQIQGLVDAVQSDRRRFQDQIEALEQSPLRGDGSRRKGKPKRTSNPKRRPGDGVLLAAQVRSYFTYLVGGSHRLLEVSVSIEEADNYVILWNTDNGLSALDCCDKDNFRYDVLGSPKSPWNMSAARVFVKAFEEWAGVELDQETTMEAVATWIKSLRQARRQSLLSRTQQEKEKGRARRQGRKRSLFQMRLSAAQQHPLLRQHVPLLERLGVDGMSSDESDVDEPGDGGSRAKRPIYQVITPAWRATEVGDWLEGFDSVYSLLRHSKQDLRGQYPRLQGRIPVVVDDKAKPVPSLPRNAYHSSWISLQRQPEFCLKPVDQDYPFWHENGLISSLQIG